MKIKTINSNYESEYRSLNSKFLGYLYPFRDKTQLNNLVTKLRKEHPKANHVCYAYRLGFENEEYRANDDGEPSGSAGKPILNQLYSYELQNCILLVVRYFGGTKLGLPGLIAAYKEAAKGCLEKVNILEDEESIEVQVSINQQDYYSLINTLKSNNIEILSSDYKLNNYILKLEVPKSKMNNISNYLK